MLELVEFYKREPCITGGFIIFREGYEVQLPSGGLGHWRTAKQWVEKRNLTKEFNKVVKDKHIKVFDYDDYLTDYIGAIRLYTLSNKLYCYIPRGNSNEYKSYLKNFFVTGDVVISNRKLHYHTYGDIYHENEEAYFYPEYIPIYNQTIIADGKGNYCYNPNRIGD